MNSLTLFILAILLARSIWSIGANETTIEAWEVERHETILRRAKRNGGFLTVPGGDDIRIERHEFPYDIGIWSNMGQSMSTENVGCTVTGRVPILLAKDSDRYSLGFGHYQGVRLWKKDYHLRPTASMVT